MVDIKNIRIGNIFTSIDMNIFRVDNIYKNDNREYVVQMDVLLSDLGKDCKFSRSIDILEPIPLTPKIIGKCGFEEYVDKNCWGYKLLIPSKYTIDTAPVYFMVYSDGTFDPSVFNRFIPIVYLHQLQNIYYDLTGRELPVDMGFIASQTHTHTEILPTR